MTPRFRAGDRVVVLDLEKTGHIRTPFYVRGHCGTIIQFCGAFLNPEQLSLGNVGGPVVPLYRVGFSLTGLWADYDGNPSDTLCIELYDHWLAPSPSTKPAALTHQAEH
jgi:nitrile hydratase